MNGENCHPNQIRPSQQSTCQSKRAAPCSPSSLLQSLASNARSNEFKRADYGSTKKNIFIKFDQPNAAQRSNSLQSTSITEQVVFCDGIENTRLVEYASSSSADVLSHLHANVRVEDGKCFAPSCAKATLSSSLLNNTDWVKSNVRWNCLECHKLKKNLNRRVERLEELQQEHDISESKAFPVSSKLKTFVTETLKSAIDSHPKRQDANEAFCGNSGIVECMLLLRHREQSELLVKVSRSK